MSDIPAPAPRPRLPFRFFEWLRRNPVILKEMRSRMRGWRSFVTLTAFVAILGGIAGMIYMGIVNASNGIPSVNDRKEMGQAIFFTIYLIELFTLSMMAPSLTSGAIANEREHQTYDLLRTTLLSAPALVLGKLIAALSYVLLLMFATLPIMSIAFIFGGISLGELAIGVLILILSAMTYGSFGIFFSSFITKSRIATVLSQAVTSILVFGLPALMLTITLIFTSSINPNQLSAFGELFFYFTLWLVIASSPIATGIITEVFLLEEQSFFFINFPLSGGTTIPAPSPWLGFLIIYPLLTFLALWLTIRIVRRADKT